MNPGGEHNPRLLRALGPGILFAGAAIGVSHLVQSTRAGALHGLSLLLFVILAHAMKLPAMVFGPRYAAATGVSLLQAYRDQGRHALGAFALITFGTMFTIQAVVTLVTAAIIKTVVLDPALPFDTPIWAASIGLLLLCAALIAAGGFKWLDRTLKALMVVLACSTLLAAALELTRLDLAGLSVLPVIPEDPTTRTAYILFVVALVGWMPAPLDISVWHSIWTIARRDQTRHAPSRRECEIDFGVGYALCVLLAACFVVLGAGTLHARGVEPAASGPAFAAQLIDLYTNAIGPWVRPVIAACAVAVMLSTTLTVLDALPRTAVQLVARFRTDADPGAHADITRTPAYWFTLALIIAGAMLIIATRGTGAGFQRLVDLATTLSFLGTPVIAWFNHRAIRAPAVPEPDHPGRLMTIWSLAGVAFWAAFAAIYLWTRVTA